MSNEPLGSLDQQLATYQKANGCESKRRAHEMRDGLAWQRFAAAAGASLAAASSADATIQYFPGPTTRVDIVSGPYNAGVDLDGIPGNDMGIGIGATFRTFPYYGYQIFGFGYGLGGASLIGASVVGSFSNVAVRRFNVGDPIPAVAPPLTGSLVHLSQSSFYGYVNPVTYNGQFGIYGTGYAGFVNNIAGSPHAGWVKIRTESFLFGTTSRLRAIEVLEWAYEDVPGMSILAGQTMSLGGPDGDYNDDGVVNPADYVVWREKQGTDDELPNDPHGGTIGQHQYETWVSNFGESDGMGSVSLEAARGVPEPSSISLGVLALGAAGVAALRRRSR